MDAIEFVKQLRRMEKNVCRKHSVFNGPPEDVVAEVEEWVKKNPAKTRQSVFLEQWPNAKKDNNGLCILCPRHLVADVFCASDGGTLKRCTDCRREFWMQEVE